MGSGSSAVLSFGLAKGKRDKRQRERGKREERKIIKYSKQLEHFIYEKSTIANLMRMTSLEDLLER